MKWDKKSQENSLSQGDNMESDNSGRIINEDAQKDSDTGPTGKDVGHHGSLGIPIQINKKGKMERARIMVVEDNNIIATDIQESLEILGYDVSIVVSSGEEAIIKAEETHPDLVLMNIILR